MLSALGLVLLNRNPRGLNLSEKDVFDLYCIFSDKSYDEIVKCLEESIEELSRQGLLPKNVRRYLSETLHKFASDISTAEKMEEGFKKIDCLYSLQIRFF